MNIAAPHYTPPRLSSEAIALVKHFEGCFLEAYRDPVGVTTIGYGHTGHIRRGMSVTPEEAEDLLMEDLDVAAADVRHNVKVPLNDNEFGALVSLAFNVGGSAFAHSTLLRKLNRGDRRGAADEFGRFVYGHISGRKRKLKGLVIRREAERQMFVAPVGQLVRGGRMVLAGRTIPVSHPTYDLAHVGPPQPPQYHEEAVSPYIVAASAEAETEPAEPPATILPAAARAERRLSGKTLATIGAGAAIGAVPATGTPAAQSLVQSLGDIWQKAGGPDVFSGGTSWLRWFEAFTSGVGQIFKQGELKPLLEYLAAFVHSNEGTIVFIATVVLMLIRAGAGSFLFDNRDSRKA